MGTESVMWRKGPENKPVLCNPCGARWITKRTLEGYLPQSAGGGKRRAKPKSKVKASTKTDSKSRGAKQVLMTSSKRVRKVPQKYADEDAKRSRTTTASVSPTKGARRGKVSLKIDLGDKNLKVMDRIPSPQKPAKKRHTARNLFVEDLASPRTTLPPKKKKHDLLLLYPYMKRTVL